MSPDYDGKVAIVHDWFPVISGAERVVEQFNLLYPQADIFSLFDFLTDTQRAEILGDKTIHASSLNRLPGVSKYYRSLILPCTQAIERFDLSSYDLVVSSSAALAKGVITGPTQLHVAYVHSPARYAWDLTHEYIDDISGTFGGVKRAIAHSMMHRFRKWDARTPNLVDQFVANSDFIRRRIWKIYRREAEVVYPPVNVADFVPSEEPKEDFFLFASRLVPYKRAPMVVEAFNRRPDLRLVVVGGGPELDRVRALAGPNVEVLGHVSFAELQRLMQKARAFVFAALEDFGIAPVEAQACGTPVIALGKGGTAETVVPLGSPGASGVLYEDQTLESLLAAIDTFVADGSSISAEDCRANAERFSIEAFRQNFKNTVSRAFADHG